MTFSTDVIRRIWNEDEGVCIEVRPWPDAPETCVELHTDGDKNVEWFGKINLSMPREMAAELGRALIAASERKV